MEGNLRVIRVMNEPTLIPQLSHNYPTTTPRKHKQFTKQFQLLRMKIWNRI